MSRLKSFISRLASNLAVRIVVKALLLFMVVDLGWGLVNPLPALSRVSAYNVVFPGRPRLPFGGGDPSKSYSLDLSEVDALFASHVLAAAPKPPGEYRVLLIGDSSVWGFLLRPPDTLAARLNAAHLAAPDGRRVTAYNLGYPILSLTKDLLILDTAARRYQPDLIVWLVTLESFPADRQLLHPLLQHNPGAVRQLIQEYQLPMKPDDPNLINQTFWDQTLIGQRSDLADLLRFQAYGVMWAATGIDQDYPAQYDRPQRDFQATDTAFHGLQPPHLAQSDLAFDVLAAGVKATGSVPVLFVNEPIYISDGQNNDVRYNFYYPRWAYDDYRQIMADQSRQQGWNYLDLWNLVPAPQFTNSAIHLTPLGSQMLADKVGGAISTLLNKGK